MTTRPCRRTPESPSCTPPPATSDQRIRLFLLRESVTLLYYPLWVAQVPLLRDRLYEMSVDGQQRGGALGARPSRQHQASASSWWRRLRGPGAVVLAVAVSAWEAYAGTARASTSTSALLLVVAAGGAFWRFRLVREVEYHEPFSS